jgi:hypothetical protein
MNKIKAQRRVVSEDEVKIQENKFIFQNKPFIVKVKLYITSLNTASYYQDINQSINSVYLYKLLCNFTTAHKELIDNHNTYKEHFNNNGITFNTTPTTQYINKLGVITLFDKSIGELVLANIKVTPYCFENNSGISIKLLSAKQL